MTRLMVVLLVLAASCVSAGAQDRQPIRVQMSEFAFHPAFLRVQAGRAVRLLLVNRGQLAHQFETGYLREIPTTVVDDGVRVDAPGLDFTRLDPGATATVAFVPGRKGRFLFACTIEGHREAGMTGVIEVY